MIRSAICAAIVSLGLASALQPSSAKADAGGLSFWLPGAFGSLAAAPSVPGWSYATIYLHLQSSGGRGANFVLPGGGRGAVAVGLTDHADALVQGITYTSALPVLGGQAAFTVLGAPGNVGVGVGATLTGPLGNTVSGVRTDNRTTFADVFYQGTLKWNQGVHNEMVYITGNIPSGTYDSGRLANLSLGFAAIDAGAGYTYFDPKAGNEFSVVAGLTYSAPEPGFAVPERHRLPHRLGGFKIPYQDVSGRRRRLLLPADHRRQRSGRGPRRLQGHDSRYRSAGWLYLS